MLFILLSYFIRIAFVNQSLILKQQYKKDTVMDCLKQLFQRMLLCNRSRISAKQLVEALKLDTKVQQDSDEFLKLIFSFICSALPDTISKTVRNKCSFSVAHSRECDNCHTTKIGAAEDCFDLELVIDHNVFFLFFSLYIYTCLFACFFPLSFPFFFLFSEKS